MNITKARADAAERLQNAGIPEYAREAASLLVFVLERPHSFFFAHPEYELSVDESARFNEVVSRRTEREPLQYITGRQEFFGLAFYVTPDVLIPRPETETLVEEAIRLMSGGPNWRLCDIGTGSGCIAISILNSVKEASAVAIDISLAALSVAEANARRHMVAERLEFRQGDLFQGVNGKFDVIAANPPYVPLKDIDGLQPEVRSYEPYSALAGGEDGLLFIRRIINESPKNLAHGGTLLIEVGFGQAAEVAGLFERNLWKPPEIKFDFQLIPRIIAAQLM